MPNLAIHLTSGDERTAFKVNTQTHLGFPVLATSIKKCAPSVVAPPKISLISSSLLALAR